MDFCPEARIGQPDKEGSGAMIKDKLIRVILLDEAKDEFGKLNKIAGWQNAKGIDNSEEMQLLNSIKAKIELLKKNPFYGDNIPKRLIPKNYDVQNLWRLELSHFWRALYTIKGDQIEIICFILNIMNHKDYDKKFGYK